MVPIRDTNPTRSTPWVTYALLAVNVFAWIYQYSLMSAGAEWVVPWYGLVPRRFLLDPAGESVTVLTSMFMHGGWGHIAGNMLFLYIFGDNVEDALGRFRYLAFYLLGGVCAAAGQILVDPSSTVPMVGASGAIAAVLGAYFVLYPRAPITVFNTIPPLWLLLGLFFEVPAWMAILYWFLIQNLLPGLGSMGQTTGVAFFAHIGGFVGGLLLVRLFLLGRSRRQPTRNWSGWRPPPRQQPPPRVGQLHDPWERPPRDRWH